jgi:hypothetical protein
MSLRGAQRRSNLPRIVVELAKRATRALRHVLPEAPQLARTNPDVVLVTDPADIGQRHVVLAVHFEGTSARNGSSPIPLDGAFEHKLSDRILVHFPDLSFPSIS